MGVTKPHAFECEGHNFLLTFDLLDIWLTPSGCFFRLYYLTSLAAKEDTMSNAETIRAWKDPEYRSTLGPMPTHPAGLIELADANLDGRAVKDGGFRAEAVRGGTFSTHHACCPRTLTHPSGLCCK